MKKVTKHILIAFLILAIFGVLQLAIGSIIDSMTLITNSFKTLFTSSLIGISYYLEKISEKKKNYKYTFGYKRYSLLGALIISIIFLQTQIFVIYSSINRIINPIEFNEEILFNFSIIGLLINLLIYYNIRKPSNINEEAVNLHIKESIYTWIGVVIASIIINYTKIYIIDPIISILITILIIYNIMKHLNEITDIFLQKVPEDINLSILKKKIIQIKKVEDVTNMHLWQVDEKVNDFTANILIDRSTKKDEIEELLLKIKKKLKKWGIENSTIEFKYKEKE